MDSLIQITPLQNHHLNEIKKISLKKFNQFKACNCCEIHKSNKPENLKVTTGASIHSIMENQKVDKPVRIISGDVLTGATVTEDQYVGFYDSTITILDDNVKFVDD